MKKTLLSVITTATVLAASTRAQQFEALHRFTRGPEAPSARLIEGSDGNFYGTTSYGGTNNAGTVFKLGASGEITTLHSFTGQPDGAYPEAGLIQASDGSFYGTTVEGGATDKGTVFKMDPIGNVTVLHSFAGQPDGAYPEAGLIQSSDGAIYGTTYHGGTADYGSVFKVNPSGILTTVHSFAGQPLDGAYPKGGVIQGSDGNFYGTTYNGGATDAGAIFKTDSAGSTTTLWSFSGQADGALPLAGLMQGADGNLYGTTFRGGANNLGTVFKIDSSLGLLTTLHSFAAGSPLFFDDGAFPEAELIQGSDGNFYGTTVSGGASNLGTVFRMDLSGNTTTLHSFSASEGAILYAGLTHGSDGNFYGTTFEGGPNNLGSIFRIDSSGNLTILVSFAAMGGAVPTAGLTQGDDRNFYGTTAFGGAHNVGTAFKMDSLGNVTTLYSFAGQDDGAYPRGGLIQGSDGKFYGTTQWAGGLNNGTVFQMDSAGTVATLHFFTGAQTDGAFSRAGLIQGSDGSFYGTTEHGGWSYLGAVFKMNSAGDVTALPSFTGQDGAFPRAGLVQASDGNYYGTTLRGGANDRGSAFKMDTAGVITTLHSFAGQPFDGAYPEAALIQGSDSNFYGTTYNGGASNSGTIFKMDSSGIVAILHSFAGNDGSFPAAGLVQGSDGNFFGTTYYGGANDSGTVFKMDSYGALTTLHSFAGSDGARPEAALAQGDDGNLYGTTSSGIGPADLGTIFRINIVTPSLRPLSVVSRKAHGSAGTFDLDLPLTGSPGIECRNGGANGDYTLVFSFSNPLTSVSGASITSGNGSVNSSAIGADPHQYVINLTGVTNAQVITVSLTNVNDSAGNGSPAVAGSMAILVGDTTADRFVNSADISQTKSQSGNLVTSSNFRQDVTIDGFLNSADISLVKSKSGTALP